MKPATLLLGLGAAALGIAMISSRKKDVESILPDDVPPPPPPPPPPPKPQPDVAPPPADVAHGRPVTVEGWGEANAPCTEDGELGIYDDLTMKRYIDEQTDPAKLERIASALNYGMPACTVRASYAMQRAKTIRERQP